jgi:hypothetical protein
MTHFNATEWFHVPRNSHAAYSLPVLGCPQHMAAGLVPVYVEAIDAQLLTQCIVGYGACLVNIPRQLLVVHLRGLVQIRGEGACDSCLHKVHWRDAALTLSRLAAYPIPGVHRLKALLMMFILDYVPTDSGTTMTASCRAAQLPTRLRKTLERKPQGNSRGLNTHTDDTGRRPD